MNIFFGSNEAMASKKNNNFLQFFFSSSSYVMISLLLLMMMMTGMKYDRHLDNTCLTMYPNQIDSIDKQENH
jgi:hypothetical protein